MNKTYYKILGITLFFLGIAFFNGIVIGEVLNNIFIIVNLLILACLCTPAGVIILIENW